MGSNVIWDPGLVDQILHEPSDMVQAEVQQVRKVNLPLEFMSVPIKMNHLPFQSERGSICTELAIKWSMDLPEGWCHVCVSALVSVSGRAGIGQWEYL